MSAINKSNSTKSNKLNLLEMLKLKIPNAIPIIGAGIVKKI